MSVTKRDRELIGYLANGHTTKEIAIMTKYAPDTVDSYRVKMCRRYGVKNSCHLVAYAFINGILKP